MKKTVLNITVIFLLAVSLFSCKEDTVEAPYLTADTEQVTFSYKGETKYITLQTNCAFTATSQAEWCRTETHRSPFNNLTLIVEFNSVEKERAADIVISAEGVSDVIIRVVQAAGVSGAKDGVNKTEPTIIEAESNSEGYGSQQLGWWVESGAVFGDHYYVSMRNGASATFPITVADAADYDFTFEVACWGTGLSLSLTVDNVLIGSVIPPVCDGVLATYIDFPGVSLSEGAHVIKVGTTGEVDFDRFIIRYNNGSPILETAVTKLEFGAGGGTKFVAVTANVPFTATPQANWISVTETTGNSFSMLVASNAGNEERTTNIVLSASGAPNVTIEVTQASVIANPLYRNEPLTIEAATCNEGKASMTNPWVTWNPGYGSGEHVHIEVNNSAVTYAINVVDAGDYDFRFSVLPWGAGTLTLSIDDNEAGSVPYTAPGLSGILLDVTNVSLSAGAHTVKVHFSANTAFELFVISAHP